jgi:hypothetical protein
MTARVCYKKLKQVQNEKSNVEFYIGTGTTVTFNENVKVIEYNEYDTLKKKSSKIKPIQILSKLFGINN